VLYFVGDKGKRTVRKWALVLPAVSLALVLTGCGQLMNVIYPSNAIAVDVRVLTSTHADWAQPGSTVSVSATSDAGQTFSQTATSGSFDGTYAHFQVTLTKLPNQKYTLVTSYTSGASGSTYYASPAPDDFFDPSGTELNMIQMPYASGTLSSNGHSISLTAYIH
jgi:hypothetical protein